MSNNLESHVAQQGLIHFQNNPVLWVQTYFMVLMFFYDTQSDSGCPNQCRMVHHLVSSAGDIEDGIGTHCFPVHPIHIKLK